MSLKDSNTITPRAKLRVKYKGNKRILQLRDNIKSSEFAIVMIVLLLIIRDSLISVAIFLVALIAIGCVIIANYYFREKIIWFPETQKLIIKSSKYKITSSSVISSSKEEDTAKKRKPEFFKFFSNRRKAKSIGASFFKV